MAWFSVDDRKLLTRVLEMDVEYSRKGNPRLRPLSTYSSELKNIKQISEALSRGVAGEELSNLPRTAQRYANTLQTHGFHDFVADGIYQLSDAGRQLTELAASGDGGPEFWRQNSRIADRLSFNQQVARLLRGEEDLVNKPWREVFFNVQILADHVDFTILESAISDQDAREFEIIQYINSVGTEPWRYGRLPENERAQIGDLILRIRSEYSGAAVDQDEAIEVASHLYGRAIDAVQRDIRFRVAGYVDAFLSARRELGADFPRATPSLEFTYPRRVRGAPNVLGNNTEHMPTPPPAPLALPRQVIISGCPGSGKSHYAEIEAGDAEVMRTQFHSDTTFASFVGSYRPVPVYQGATDVTELDGASFPRGKPLIDYRFVAGPALSAIAVALEKPDKNVVLLVEELNRANAAAAFGDFFQLLDRRSDGWSRYDIDLQAEIAAWLASRGCLELGKRLRLPPNLYIWATMNSGDQGVFPIDTAFRRRWSFRYLGYSQGCDYPEGERQIRFAGQAYDWDVFRGQINRKLKQLRINEDRLVGPYFLTKEQLSNPHEILDKLLLYLWDDVLRFRQHELFLADSFSGVSATWVNGRSPFIVGIIDPSLAITAEVVVDEATMDADQALGGDAPANSESVVDGKS